MKVKIGDFLFERKGKYKPSDKAIQGLKRIEKIDFSGKFHIGDKSSKTNMILVKKGDLVISGINVAKGAMGIYTGDEDVVATIHYSSYTFDESKINVDYFKRFLKSAEFIRLLKEQIKGGIKTEIKPKHLLPLEIDLPDLEIQNEIVSKFEAVEDDMATLDNEIQTQQTLLKKLRQSILQEAIEGKLIADWRAAHPNVEPASVLLEKIRTEKERLVKEKKIRKQKPLPPIEEREVPFEIPESWEWCRFGDVIYENPRNGYSPKAVDYETSIKTLKLGAITYGYFDASQFKYINENIEKDSFLWLKEGDILIQRSNSLEYVGMAGIYTGNDFEFIYPDLIMKAKASQFVDNVFILKFLLSPVTREYFQKNASGSQKNMPKINQSIVMNTLIALPPLEEQKEIVKKIENLFTLCDALEAQIDQSKTNSEALMQAVLREAFEG